VGGVQQAFRTESCLGRKMLINAGPWFVILCMKAFKVMPWRKAEDWYYILITRQLVLTSKEIQRHR
jgi:hypothetical protein